MTSSEKFSARYDLDPPPPDPDPFVSWAIWVTIIVGLGVAALYLEMTGSPVGYP